MSVERIDTIRDAAREAARKEMNDGDGSERPRYERYADAASDVWADAFGQVEAERDALRAISQRIRAGWLPHYLSQGGWWGRPAGDDGYRLWSEGLVPSMAVVERMTEDEVTVWSATLHPMAPEAVPVPPAADSGTPPAKEAGDA